MTMRKEGGGIGHFADYPTSSFCHERTVTEHHRVATENSTTTHKPPRPLPPENTHNQKSKRHFLPPIHSKKCVDQKNNQFFFLSLLFHLFVWANCFVSFFSSRYRDLRLCCCLRSLVTVTKNNEPFPDSANAFAVTPRSFFLTVTVCIFGSSDLSLSCFSHDGR